MSGPAFPREYPPLLPVGLHRVTLSELRSLCVIAFPESRTRERIFEALSLVIARLNAVEVEGELWINGSFLTRKQDPDDVDVILRIEGPFYDSASPAQRDIIDWVADNLYDSYRCDSYLLVEWPAGHRDYWLGQYFRAYWLRQWGFSRDNELKGIAVIQLGGRKS